MTFLFYIEAVRTHALLNHSFSNAVASSWLPFSEFCQSSFRTSLLTILLMQLFCDLSEKSTWLIVFCHKLIQWQKYTMLQPPIEVFHSLTGFIRISIFPFLSDPLSYISFFTNFASSSPTIFDSTGFFDTLNGAVIINLSFILVIDRLLQIFCCSFKQATNSKAAYLAFLLSSVSQTFFLHQFYFPGSGSMHCIFHNSYEFGRWLRKRHFLFL